MELEQMRQLISIEREGSISGAARSLHLSQPALSRSIQRLEAELGVTLFTRIGRRIELNEAGRTAVDWARQIMREERLMCEAIRNTAHRTQTLRVCSVAPAPLWFLTSRLMEQYPRETLTTGLLAARDIERELIDGSCDLGILTEPPASCELSSCELMREKLSVSLPPSHPLSTRHSLSLAELDGNTFLLFSEIGFWRELVHKALPHAVFIEQSDRMVFSQLVRTTPHCFFTTDAPSNDSAIPGRVELPIDDPIAQAVFYLVKRTDAGEIAENLFAWAQNKKQDENTSL